MLPARIKTVFMGSDAIALPAFEAIRTHPRVEVVGVFTQPDRPSGRGQQLHPGPIKIWALEHGLAVLQPERVSDAEIEWIKESGARLCFVKGYGQLLKQVVLDAFDLSVWNFHVSILPNYRGSSPMVGAIAAGAEISGVSLMRLVLKMDAGPVLGIESVALDSDETQVTLGIKLAQCSKRLVDRYLISILEDNAVCEEQDESKATYVRKLSKADAALDWNVPAVEIECRIRALMPWPGSSFSYKNDTIKIGLPLRVDFSIVGSPGELIAIRDGMLWIATGKGVLGIGSVQRPGGKMISVDAFVCGYLFEMGFILPSYPIQPLVLDVPAQKSSTSGQNS